MPSCLNDVLGYIMPQVSKKYLVYMDACLVNRTSPFSLVLNTGKFTNFKF